MCGNGAKIVVSLMIPKGGLQVGIAWCEEEVGSATLRAVKYRIEVMLLPITVFIILAFVWFLLRDLCLRVFFYKQEKYKIL